MQHMCLQFVIFIIPGVMGTMILALKVPKLSPPANCYFKCPSHYWYYFLIYLEMAQWEIFDNEQIFRDQTEYTIW